MNTAFDIFKRNFNLIKFTYNGIKLNQIISYQLWNMGVSSKYKSGWRGCFKTLNISAIQYSLGASILSTCSTSRSDQLSMNDYALAKIDKRIIPNHLCEEKYEKSCLHPYIMLQCFVYVFIVLNRFTVKQKIHLFFDLVHYCNCIYDLKKIDTSNIRKYITFLSCCGLDSLFTQFMKNRGIITYSLSEGLHLYWQKDVPVDIIHFTNFVSDYKFCLSECHKNEFVKFGISPEKLLVGGYLKNVEKKALKSENKFKKCLVLLCRSSYEKANLKLLDILAKCNQTVDFYVKLHPDNNFDFYQKFADNNGFCIIEKNKGLLDCLKQEEYDFCIAVNTNCYYDSLIVGIPCLRFDDGSFDGYPGIDEDIFYDLHSLEYAMAYIKKTEIYQKKIDSMLTYVIGFGVDNYQKEFFKNTSEMK